MTHTTADPATSAHPQPTLVLTPARAAAPAGEGTLDLLVRVQAPDAPPAGIGPAPQRQPLRLALVVDRSGSMAGEPLQEALRCVEAIAEGLTARDQVAVVLYDDQVQVPVPLGPGGDADRIRRALAGVESGGTTALFDGWQQGARLLEGGLPGTLSRVLLLSDGQANRGLDDAAAIGRHCADWAGRGVGTTTIGLGAHFHEDLMLGMARAGGGQSYYGRSAEDLRPRFEEELQLLQALWLRRLRVSLLPGPGVVAQPLGLVRRVTEGGQERCLLPDLAWGAEAWLAVRLHLAAQPGAGADPRQPQALLAVVAEGEAADGQVLTCQGTLALPRIAASDWERLPEDPLVRERVQEVTFIDALEQVQALVQDGALGRARTRLEALERQVAGHAWLAAKCARLRQLVDEDASGSVKEMAFSVWRSSNRLAAKDASVQACMASSPDVPAFLRLRVEEGSDRDPPAGDAPATGPR